MLCLRLEGAGTNKQSLLNSACEAFLKFSPRLAARPAAAAGVSWLFLDVASTARLHGGEEAALEAALELAKDFEFLDASASVSDTPSGAQAFAASRPRRSPSGSSRFICPPGEERANLQPLSLPLLLQLEGLEPWPQPSAIESMADFFHEVGFRRLGDLDRFAVDSMRERWGATGELVWKRLRALDRRPISPFAPSEPLREGGHFDFPLSLVSLLLHASRRPLERLFARLQGRGLFAEKATFELRGEYSGSVRVIELEPRTPSRNLDLFMTLLERKLDQAGAFDDPVRAFDLSVIARPEEISQLDFFEPRETDSERVENLMSVLKQTQAEASFFQPRQSLIPERAWTRESGAPVHEPSPTLAFGRTYRLDALSESDRAAYMRQLEANAIPESLSHRPSLSEAPGWGRPPEPEENPARSVRPLPEYGADVMEAPRPTRLLETPKQLSAAERREIKLLNRDPVERLDGSWWSDRVRRDYRFAVSKEGQCLWIFQNAESGEWFLHGYFD